MSSVGLWWHSPARGDRPRAGPRCLGTATSATLASFFGVRTALAGMASLIVVLGMLVYAKAGSIRRLDA